MYLVPAMEVKIGFGVEIYQIEDNGLCVHVEQEEHLKLNKIRTNDYPVE